MYTEIAWEEIRRFFKKEKRRYADTILRGWKEKAYVKNHSRRNLMIVFATTFIKTEDGNIQRKYGRDAFRLLLKPRSHLSFRKVYWQMISIKRETHWKKYLEERLSLLEEFIRYARVCSKCGGCPVPAKEKKEDDWYVYWKCERYRKGKYEYHDIYEVPQELTDRLMSKTKLPKRRK